MTKLLSLTQLLYSCWIVSDTKGQEGDSVPTGGGILGYALRDAVSKGAFPEWARQQLHFVDGDTGFTCVELPFIEKLATEIKLTSDPNPSYTRTKIVVGKPIARRCLSRLNVSEEMAIQWGRILREAAQAAETKLQVA